MRQVPFPIFLKTRSSKSASLLIKKLTGTQVQLKLPIQHLLLLGILIQDDSAHTLDPLSFHSHFPYIHVGDESLTLVGQQFPLNHFPAESMSTQRALQASVASLLQQFMIEELEKKIKGGRVSQKVTMKNCQHF